MICLTLSILGCSQGSTQRSPTAPTPPVATPPPQPAPPAPSNRYALWGVVVTSSGVCIEGATVEVVEGPELLGVRVAQTLPCDLRRSTGGFGFDDVPPAMMTLRASAPGYVSQEQTIEPGLLEIVTFTLVPTASDDLVGSQRRARRSPLTIRDRVRADARASRDTLIAAAGSEG